MLDDLDFLFKSDMARRLMFYYQEEVHEEETDISQLTGQARTDAVCRANLLKMQRKGVQPPSGGDTRKGLIMFNIQVISRCKKVVS